MEWTTPAQRRPRRLEPMPLAQASAWLERYRKLWELRFEALDGLLEEMKRIRATPRRRGRGRR